MNASSDGSLFLRTKPESEGAKEICISLWQTRNTIRDNLKHCFCIIRIICLPDCIKVFKRLRFDHNNEMLAIIPILAATIPTVYSQSYTFPLGPNQGYPQYSSEFEYLDVITQRWVLDAFQSRYPYIPNQQMQMSNPLNQMNGYPSMNQMNQLNQIPQSYQMNAKNQMNGGANQLPIHQRYSFNPMTRIQVQPPMQGNSENPLN